MPCAPGCGEMGACHPNREDLLMRIYGMCKGAGGHYKDALEAIMGELADAIWPDHHTCMDPTPDVPDQQGCRRCVEARR